MGRNSHAGIALPDRDMLAASGARVPSRFRIELSIATGGRIGDGQASVGVGVVAFLEVSGWLVGFEGRLDRYDALASGGVSGGDALELAVLGGRRFHLRSVTFDLAAGPALVPQGTATYSTTQGAPTGQSFTASSSSTAPRLVVGARVTFRPRSTVQPFVGIDGDMGATRLGEGVPGAPRLPAWALGLALGATVGTR